MYARVPLETTRILEMGFSQHNEYQMLSGRCDTISANTMHVRLRQAANRKWVVSCPHELRRCFTHKPMNLFLSDLWMPWISIALGCISLSFSIQGQFCLFFQIQNCYIEQVDAITRSSHPTQGPPTQKNVSTMNQQLASSRLLLHIKCSVAAAHLHCLEFLRFNTQQ